MLKPVLLPLICLLMFMATVFPLAAQPQPLVASFESGEVGRMPQGWFGGGAGYGLQITDQQP